MMGVELYFFVYFIFHFYYIFILTNWCSLHFSIFEFCLDLFIWRVSIKLLIWMLHSLLQSRWKNSMVHRPMAHGYAQLARFPWQSLGCHQSYGRSGRQCPTNHFGQLQKIGIVHQTQHGWQWCSCQCFPFWGIGGTHELVGGRHGRRSLWQGPVDQGSQIQNWRMGRRCSSFGRRWNQGWQNHVGLWYVGRFGCRYHFEKSRSNWKVNNSDIAAMKQGLIWAERKEGKIDNNPQKRNFCCAFLGWRSDYVLWKEYYSTSSLKLMDIISLFSLPTILATQVQCCKPVDTWYWDGFILLAARFSQFSQRGCR